jgi:hypothetical protein
MKDDNKGIKKRRRRIPFDSGVKQLQQYYERYGHSNVPVSLPLGKWCSNLRHERLTDEQRQTLKSLKFTWRAHEMILGIGGGTSTSVSNIWSTRQSRLLINGLTISGNKKPGGYFQKRNWTSLTKGDSDGKEGQLISYVLECHMPSVAGGSR